MSAVGSVSASSTERLQALLMQQALSASGNATLSTSSGISTTGTDDSTGNTKGMSALKKAIEEAIASALASLGKSSNAQEVMDTVKNAVDQTLEANGVDLPAQPGGPPPNGAGGPPPGPPPGGGGSGDLGSTIDRLLQEAGFDPDEIRSELMQQNGSSTRQTNTTTGTATSTAATASSLLLLVQLPLNGGVDTQA